MRCAAPLFPTGKTRTVDLSRASALVHDVPEALLLSLTYRPTLPLAGHSIWLLLSEYPAGSSFTIAGTAPNEGDADTTQD
jgi:hypothetical protein